jgi:uncharacterized membrane protein
MSDHSPSVEDDVPPIDLDRLAGLTDAVIAFALTLLVLDLKPPEGVTNGVIDDLEWLWPKLIIYFVVFASVANYWNIHQRSFSRLRRGDPTLVMLSLLVLLFLTLVPASTVILGRHPTDPLGMACYSGNWVLLSLTTWAMWRHVASRSALLRDDAYVDRVRHVGDVWLFVGVGNVVAIVIAFLNIYAAYAVWIMWPVLATAWWYRRSKAPPAQHPALPGASA